MLDVLRKDEIEAFKVAVRERSVCIKLERAASCGEGGIDALARKAFKVEAWERAASGGDGHGQQKLGDGIIKQERPW